MMKVRNSNIEVHELWDGRCPSRTLVTVLKVENLTFEGQWKDTENSLSSLTSLDTRAVHLLYTHTHVYTQYIVQWVRGKGGPAPIQ